MPAGELRHRVTVQAPTFTENELGEKLPDWREWRKLWAKLEPVSAREAEFARSFKATVSHKVTLRYVADLLPSYRIHYQGRTFAIDGVVNVEERNRELWVFCTELKAAA